MLVIRGACIQGGLYSGGLIFMILQYMKFENEIVVNKRKDVCPCGELELCVPINVQTNTLPLAKKDNVRVQLKQYPLFTAQVLTIHKAQGGTQEYMTDDLDRITKAGSRILSLLSVNL